MTMPDRVKQGTLLAHLAWMFSSQHEDIAVEALGYILQSESARQALVRLVQDGGAGGATIAKVQTQVSGEGGTRPDLVGLDQEGNECMMIEAKFWAARTANQPNAYLDRLPPHGSLLFVAPASGVESLWAELQSAAASSTTSLADMPELKSARIGGCKHLMLASWERLLRSLEAVADVEVQVEVRQLRGLTATAESPRLHLSSARSGHELDLEGLVRDAAAGAVTAGCASTSGLRATPRKYGYGKYIRISGAGAWLGVDTRRWASGSRANTPIWLCFERWTSEEMPNSFEDVVRALKAHRRLDEDGYCAEEEAAYVPVPLPEDVKFSGDFAEQVKGSMRVRPFPYAVDYDCVLRTVVERIVEVGQIIEHRPSN